MKKNNTEKFKARLVGINSTGDYIELDDYFDLVKDILRELGDKKWAMEIYQGILDGIDEEGEVFYIESYAALSKDILKTLKDRAWVTKICKKVEGKIAGRGGVFYDYCLLSKIVMENLKDKPWAIKLLKKAEKKVGESVGEVLEDYAIDEESSCHAIFATKILDILNDQKWAARIIVDTLCNSDSSFDSESNFDYQRCGGVIACQSGKFAETVWNLLHKGGDLTDAQCFGAAYGIMQMDIGDFETEDGEEDVEMDEAWHKKNIKWAKIYMKKGIDIMEDSLECRDSDFDNAENTLRILKDAGLAKLYKKAKKAAYSDD